MLSPLSAEEVRGADEGQYNAGAVLPQGAFDVQSIRPSKAADPWAKQTRPFCPARRSTRVNSRPGVPRQLILPKPVASLRNVTETLALGVRPNQR